MRCSSVRLFRQSGNKQFMDIGSPRGGQHPYAEDQNIFAVFCMSPLDTPASCFARQSLRSSSDFTAPEFTKVWATQRCFSSKNLEVRDCREQLPRTVSTHSCLFDLSCSHLLHSNSATQSVCSFDEEAEPKDSSSLQHTGPQVAAFAQQDGLVFATGHVMDKW